MFASTLREELARRQGQLARIYTDDDLGSTAGVIGVVLGDLVVFVDSIGYGPDNIPIDSIQYVIVSP